MDERVAEARAAAYGRGTGAGTNTRLPRLSWWTPNQLGDPVDGQSSALLLYRAAAALLVRAELLRTRMDPGPSATTEECWTRLGGAP